MAARWEELVGLGDHIAADSGPALAIKPGKSHVYSTAPLDDIVGFSPPTAQTPFAVFSAGKHRVHPPSTGLGILGACVGALEWVEVNS